MTRYNILYRGLRSRKDGFLQVSLFDRFLDTFNSVVSLSQRALIVLENPENHKISEAYTVVGYVIGGHDGKVRNLLFEKQRTHRSEKELRKTLSRGEVIETYLDLDENGNVDGTPLEQYLMEHGSIVGMFSLLQNKYGKAWKRRSRITLDLYSTSRNSE